MAFFGFEDAQIWVCLGLNLPTAAALMTERSGGGWIGAVERFGKAQGQCAPPDAGWSGEEIRMAQLIAPCVDAQQVNSPVVSVNMPVHTLILA